MRKRSSSGMMTSNETAPGVEMAKKLVKLYQGGLTKLCLIVLQLDVFVLFYVFN